MRVRILIWLLLLSICGCRKPDERVVLYSAQDQEFADKILAKFGKDDRLRVDSKFDTEADKSVSLYAELVREKSRPRCDVHWNNEILSTIRLQRQGVLDPYETPSAESYPASAKAKDHTWHAFAARARILIVNTKLLKPDEMPRSLLDLADSRWKGKLVMAKPMFGTTATQAACLFEVLGKEKAQEFYRALVANGITIVPGNKQVAEGVGRSEFAVGLTDTDDAMEEVEAGRPVAIVFPDRNSPRTERMGTLFIPNTVAIIHRSPNPVGAKKLVDYLLSAEVEAALAEGGSHQIPMNPKVKAKLPNEIVRPEDVKTMEVDFEKAADLWEETQAFLRETFAR